MKKILSSVLGLMMTASVSFAADLGDTTNSAPAVSSTPVAASVASTPTVSSTTVVSPAVTTAPGAVSTPAVISTPSVVTTPSAVITPVATKAPKAAASTGPSNGGFFIQVDGGLVLPVSSQASTVFGSGWDALGKVGIAFDNTWSLGIKSGYSSLPYSSTTAANFNEVPLLLEGQFNITDGPFTPYITLGAGVVFDSISFTNVVTNPSFTTSWTNFALDPGIGFSYAFDKSFKLFLEADWIMDFQNTGTNVSAEGSDNPLMLIPVNLGVNFLL
jgi:opacity protein-like surface antigen